jgi:hypothetical protein
MASSHRLLKWMRFLHLYLGVFTAPALIFFAVTGGLQTFGLHEAARDGSYKPPAWLTSMGMLHKKQTTVVPQRRPRELPGGAAVGPGATPVAGRVPTPVDASRKPDAGEKSSAAAAQKKNLLPMKLFFALVSLSLLISTLTGIYLSWRYTRRPRLLGGILLAGLVVPILLTLV